MDVWSVGEQITMKQMSHAISDIDTDARTAKCATCGETDIYIYDDRPPFCATLHRKRSREHRANNREYYRQKAKEYRKRNAKQNKLERDLLRERVLAAYGHECECCGETRKEFLALDHIGGGGKKHRESLGLSGGKGFHAWLERNNFPDIIRILCHNCNCALGFYGHCPHEKERVEHY